MEEKLICPICGKPTRVYMGNARKDRLCASHANMLKTGEIILDENGRYLDKQGTVLFPLEIAKPKEKVFETVENEEIEIITKCIACGKETKNGNFFCIQCYRKYRDKNLLIRITRCKEIEIMDESYEGIFVCKDGHIVKSMAEREIDNYLFGKGILHAYEKSIVVDEKNIIHPDFCLPNFMGSGKDVYIEHWGVNTNNIEYNKSMKYKMKIYDKMGLTIISTYSDDMKDPETSLDQKLTYFKFGERNFTKE